MRSPNPGDHKDVNVRKPDPTEGNAPKNTPRARAAQAQLERVKLAIEILSAAAIIAASLLAETKA